MMKLWRFFLSGWKKFAAALGWLNTRILLTIIYFILISPLALLYRLFGHRFLEVKLDKSADTYWVERPGKRLEKETYYRQF